MGIESQITQIETDVKHMKNVVRGLHNNMIEVMQKLDKLITEKAPRDRSDKEKRAKEALVLNDKKPVEIKVNDAESVYDADGRLLV